MADGLLSDPCCAFHRNVEISSRYAWMYKLQPACFKWAAMAAIASHHVRLATSCQATPSMKELLDDLRPRGPRRPSRSAPDGLIRGQEGNDQNCCVAHSIITWGRQFG